MKVKTSIRMERRYFTLIELLVVVSIIAILAAILLPVLSKAKEKARIVVCLGNHKQMVMASQLYAVDHDGWAVTHKWYKDYAGWKGTHHWSPTGQRLLNQYLGGDAKSLAPPRTDGAGRVTECPSDKGDPLQGFKSVWQSLGNSYGVQYASYGNTNISHSTSKGQDSGWEVSVKWAQFAQPEAKIFQYSIAMLDNRPWADVRTRKHGQGFSDLRTPLSFVDGHAVNFYVWWRASDSSPSGVNTLNGDQYMPHPDRVARDGYY